LDAKFDGSCCGCKKWEVLDVAEKSLHSIAEEEMGWCCCSVEEEDFNKVSTDAHNHFSGHNGISGKPAGLHLDGLRIP
jgi:hypothetical protein